MSNPGLNGSDSERALLSPDKPNLGLSPAPCPVVALGASAGGLEAFQNFLGATPADGGIAYVLVQHLDPNHESMLAELLGRRTDMPVRQIRDGQAIQPNNVYLIPPNASLAIEQATLRLKEFSEPRGFRRPIDDFFRSLAVDQGANAACAVLSGTGGDGSEGLRAVKEAGGLTLVQDPASAKYDGMPKSAVATGLVDKVLDVAAMPMAIRDYFDRGPATGFSVPDVGDLLPDVCAELRHRLGHDFSQYKRSTMLRRVQRRMHVVGARNGTDYLSQLRDAPNEAELLFRDLLINVTCFFRDAEAFAVIRRTVIPELLANRGVGEKVRIWTPGCSSGEEAYSIAILIAEELSRARVRPTVQIFATDIDEPMLQKARSASYPQSAVRDVPLELLDRHFFAQDGEFVLSQPIRDMVRVSNHNLIKDPPFSRVDMIVCRNLLIYLNATLQQRLIPVFHYALRKDGLLFLGSAENIAARADLFDAVDHGARIYRRRGVARQFVSMPLMVDPPGRALSDGHFNGGGQPPAERIDIAARRVLERYAPAHVVVNANGEILRSSSRTGKYLELTEGAPSHAVTDLARRGLRSAVRGVLDTARRANRRAVKRDVRVESEDNGPIWVDVAADPLSNEETLIVFQDASTLRSEEDRGADVDVDGYSEEEHIRQLEDELDETRLKLRTTVEELETSNEELKSSNEEMMSMNEELQSTNEELATVNEELKNKVDQLGRANSDLQNFIEGTRVPTIFLDRRLRIRSFTPATKALFRLHDQDHGRLLTDVVSLADQKLIEAMARKVLETSQPIEQEIEVDEGREHHVLRVLPYKDIHGGLDGVILVFSDVTKIRQTQADLAKNESIARQHQHEIETLYRTAPVGMALVDRNKRYLKINKHFADLTGRPMDDHIGRTLLEIAPALAQRMERPIEEVFEHEREVVNFEASILVDDGSARDFLIDFYPYEEDGRTVAVGIILKAVTELRRLERELRRLMDELQHRVKNTLASVASIVNQTVATKGDRQEVVDTLKRRIGALAATHTLLTEHDWKDASLADIVETELRPFDHRDRIELDGPEIRLPPKHALTLTMTLHELATNAAKYGALADPGGRLKLTWMLNETGAGKRLTIRWREKGVPIRSKADIKPGFGTRLIKNAVAHDLQGRVEHRLTDDGLRCVISLPLA